MSATKTTLIAVVVLVLTFGAGVAVGVFADHVMMVRGIGRHGGIPPFATHMMVNRLGRHLDLTAAQKAQVERILDRHHASMDAAWASLRPRIREELEQANAEISAVLTPKQRAKFEELKLRLHGGPEGPHRGL